MLLGTMSLLGLECLLGHWSKGSLALGDQDGLRKERPIWKVMEPAALSVPIPTDAYAPRRVDVAGIIQT